jgi:hypothetical protein
MEYTKGEWSVKFDKMANRISIIDEKADEIAQVFPFGAYRERDNARLISAAPDLYEACRGFMDNADDIELTTQQALRLFPFIKGMQAAITKAEGKVDRNCRE